MESDENISELERSISEIPVEGELSDESRLITEDKYLKTTLTGVVVINKSTGSTRTLPTESIKSHLTVTYTDKDGNTLPYKLGCVSSYVVKFK